MVSTKITGLAVVALYSALSSAKETCLNPETRLAPVHGYPGWPDVCADQIRTCAAICGEGKVAVNTCTRDALNDEYEGSDSAYFSINYCFECTCTDGAAPDLIRYVGTVPFVDCWRTADNCRYSYESANDAPIPEGVCPTCDGEYAPGQEPEGTFIMPSRIDTPAASTSVIASSLASSIRGTVIGSSAPVPTSAPPAMTTSTIYSTTLITVTSCAPTVTDCPAGPHVTTSIIAMGTTVYPVPVGTAAAAGNATLVSSKTSVASGTQTPKPVSISGAGMVEPVVGVIGMVMAAVFAM